MRKLLIFVALFVIGCNPHRDPYLQKAWNESSAIIVEGNDNEEYIFNVVGQGGVFRLLSENKPPKTSIVKIKGTDTQYVLTQHNGSFDQYFDIIPITPIIQYEENDDVR